jgi:DNA-3-methyladenine glycosylase I
MTLFISPKDDIPRCGWCAATEDYIAYHDDEWGYPVDNDIRLFEKI